MVCAVYYDIHHVQNILLGSLHLFPVLRYFNSLSVVLFEGVEIVIDYMTYSLTFLSSVRGLRTATMLLSTMAVSFIVTIVVVAWVGSTILRFIENKITRPQFSVCAQHISNLEISVVAIQ